MPYADEPYFNKSPKIDEQFGISQQFSTKLELKVKIVDFHVQWNCNALTEVLWRRHLSHPSDDLRPTSAINKKNNRETKQSQLIKLSNRSFNDATSL
jgi:hypothetical protein